MWLLYFLVKDVNFAANSSEKVQFCYTLAEFQCLIKNVHSICPFTLSGQAKLSWTSCFLIVLTELPNPLETFTRVINLFVH